MECITVTYTTDVAITIPTSGTPTTFSEIISEDVMHKVASAQPGEQVMLEAGDYYVCAAGCDAPQLIVNVIDAAVLDESLPPQVGMACSKIVTMPPQVFLTGFKAGPPDVPQLYTSGTSGENLTLINANVLPHSNPYFDAAGYYDGDVYAASPNAAPSETLYLNKLDKATGDSEEIATYTVSDIVNFQGEINQLAAKGATVIGNKYYFVTPSKFFGTIGRLVEINLVTLVATDIGQAPLSLGIGDDLVRGEGDALYMFDDGVVKQWDFNTNTLGAEVFTFPEVGDGWTGAAYQADGVWYAVAYFGEIPDRSYTIVKTEDGVSHEEFPLVGRKLDDVTITDAALRPSYEASVTGTANITCDGASVCCVDEEGNKIPCPPELDSLLDIQACIAANKVETTVIPKEVCVQIPAQTGSEITGDALSLELIGVTDANASCVSEFTYDGEVYPVDPNVCVKGPDEAFGGDLSEFTLAFRDAFYAMTGVQMPSIVGVGESSEIISEQPVYAGLSFSTAPETVPTGIASDGNFYYDVGGGDIIRVRDLDGVLTGAEYSVLAQTNFAQDIAVDDNFIWVASKSPDAIFQYNKSDGTYTGFTFAVTSPDGIAIDDEGFLWIVNDAADAVSRFDPSTGIATGETFSLIAAGVTVDPSGIEWIDGFMWITDASLDSVYQFDTSGNINAALTFSVAAQDTTPLGITYDGTHIVIVGNATDTAYKYSYNSYMKYGMYLPSEGSFDASLLTAMTMVNKDASGAIVETKVDVVGAYQEHSYNTLSFSNINGYANQIMCFNGCNEVSRRLEALDGASIDPSFAVIPCDSRYRDNVYKLLTNADSPYTLNRSEWHSISLEASGGTANLTIDGATTPLLSGKPITFNVDSTSSNLMTIEIPVDVEVLFVGIR